MLSNIVEKALAERERAERVKRFHNDPEGWAKYMLGAHLWSKQKEIAQSVVINKNTIVKAGHGVGKSFLAGVLICWWVDTRYPDCFVASTAPSVAQINAIVWREVRKFKRLIEERYEKGLVDHKLPGYITSDAQWKSDIDGTIIGFGRKPPDEKMDDAFQGIHGNVLAIGDEAVGLPESLIDALGNITSSEQDRRLLLLNPTNPISYVAKIFKEKMSTWARFTISVFDSPNYTGEKVPEEAKKTLTGKEYAAEKEVEYGGKDTARYRARVEGEFSFDGTKSLITDTEINIAVDVDITPSSETRPVLGVDVARFGPDKSVIYINHDGRVRLYDEWGKTDGVTTAEKINAAALETGASVVKIDGSGLGGPIADMVARLSQDRYSVLEMLGGAASPDNYRWHNARAYWWDEARRKLGAGEIDIDIMDDKLTDELLSVEYTLTKQKNAVLIESKDDMASRGMKSPDFADAFIYAVSDVEALVNDPLQSLETGSFVFPDMGYTAIDVIGW